MGRRCYETARIGEYVELAVRTALSGVPGPAFLEIPMDVLHGPVDLAAAPLPPFRDYRVSHAASPAHIAEALDVLAAAERPMVMAGTALKWSEGADALRRFVEKVRIPCFTNGMGRGQLPMNHEQFFNRSRRNALAEADVVLLAGTPLDFRMKFGRSIPADAKIVQLDLDETLIGQNRPADVGLVGNLGANLDALGEAIDASDKTLDFSDWSTKLRAIEVEAEAALAPSSPRMRCRSIHFASALRSQRSWKPMIR